MISFEMKENAYRPDRRQLAAWAYNSGETMRWLIDRAAEANAQCTDLSLIHIFLVYGWCQRVCWGDRHAVRPAVAWPKP